MNYIIESEKILPVVADVDLCVIGGSCTGVFAAIRAARMGLSVVLCEKMGMLGGTATLGLVNIWHAVSDIDDQEQVIAGLTGEVLERLDHRGALLWQPLRTERYNFNPCELACILDEMVKESKLRLMLHTLVCDVTEEDHKVTSVIIENADGRQAIRAKFFIDCSGNGVVARKIDIPSFLGSRLQPPTYCFHLQGDMTDVDLKALFTQHGKKFDLPDDWGWSTRVAGCENITMRAENHIVGVNCEQAETLTYAEVEGRRMIQSYVQMLRRYGRKDTRYAITNLASSIGIRETRHYKTRFTATEIPLLTGQRYEAPIMQGTYPIDIHHISDGGITFKHLDGRSITEWGKLTRREVRNWRADMGLSGPYAKYYQVPFDILVGETYQNFIAAGRMVNADEGAYGALRVMVNLNQIGEAAGVAAALCLQNNCSLQKMDGRKVTEALRDGGSAL